MLYPLSYWGLVTGAHAEDPRRPSHHVRTGPGRTKQPDRVAAQVAPALRHRRAAPPHIRGVNPTTRSGALVLASGRARPRRTTTNGCTETEDITVDLGLRGSAALVTGGNRGIGLATARALVAEGARVALLGRDTEALAVARETLGPETVTVVADTTDDAQVRRAVDAAAGQLGRLDVVVNAAAPRATGAQPTGLAGLDEADFLRQVDTKALGYLRVVRAALPHLLAAGGGSVVNISGMNARSTGAIAGSVRNIAVVALSKNLADELGPHGISVVCVHPGLTVTERNADDPEYAAKAAGLNALGRAISAEEVADVVAFLASPRGRVANGSVVTVDGGRPGAIWA
ncbi:SDR family oxidoreductase [Nocardioides sp. dk4132]|nr:SDR family oxidoreductase [Nocardioides sp. dk4132]QGA06506.1 SDR family oxidoreductase [Nocardioides sp. dk884]